jgi:S1-C subfamily serine protease
MKPAIFAIAFASAVALQLNGSDDRLNAQPPRLDRTRNESRVTLRGQIPTRVDANRIQNFNTGIRFGTGNRRLTIETIEPNSFYFDSGLRRGDVIVAVEGQPVRTDFNLVTWVRSRPGLRIPVTVLRNGRQQIVYVTYRQEVIQPKPVVVYEDQQELEMGGFLGVMFDTEAPDAAIVRSVFPQSPAAQIGLRAGDEIVALNSEAISTYRQAVEMVESMQPGEPIGITFRRQIVNQAEALLATRPGTIGRTATRPVEIRVSGAPQRAVVVQPGDAVAPTIPQREVIQSSEVTGYY